MDTYDLTRSIPSANLIALGLVLILSVSTPIVAIRSSRMKYHGRWKYLFFGVMDFIVVEMIVCTYLLSLIILIPGMTGILENQPPVFIVLHTLLTGVLAELGAFFILKYSAKDVMFLGTPIMLGAGVAAARSLILILSNTFQTLVVCMSINDAGLTQLAEAAGENLDELMATIEPLFHTSAADYLITGIDIPVTFVLYICLFLLMYAVLKGKLPNYFIAIAMTIRFLFELPTYFSAYEYFPSYVAELISIGIVAGTAYFTHKIVKTHLSNDIEDIKIESNFRNRNQPQKPFPKFNQNINK